MSCGQNFNVQKKILNRPTDPVLFLFIYFISLLHRNSQGKAIIKSEGELDVEKSFSVCVNVHVLL